MSLPADFEQAAARFCRAGTVLVATDFDGVLAPFVTDPLDARALEGTLEALAGLAALYRTHAAVVSGRDLDTLTSLTALPTGAGVTHIGSHGAQSSRAAGDGGLAPEQRELLGRLTADLRELVQQHPQARLELKPAATVLHTRGLPEPAAQAAAAGALDVASRHAGVHVMRGKGVVEMAVVQADKGSALVALRDEVGAQAVAYFGDDVTDEHAFAALAPDDLTVKIGPGATAARLRLDGPQDMAPALQTLLRLRRAALS